MKIKLSLLLLFSFISISLEAKSYVFGGAGLQFDLGSLGATIMKDGLASSQGPGQQALVAENKLQSAEASTAGIVHVNNAGGAMTGGVLSLGYEKDLGEYFFTRAGINYTDKIAGGNTRASVGPYDFYNVRFNYSSLIVPLHIGVKIHATDNVSFYLGGGVNYYQGGWGVKGRVDGKALSANGLSAVSDALGISKTQIYDEDIQFRVKGMGFNWVIGASGKVNDANSIFFEVETILSGKMGSGVTKSEGGKQAMSYKTYYPVVLAGSIYKFGVSHEL